jgi:hypothetical protein
MKQGFQERLNDTAGGKLAAGIRASMEPDDSNQEQQFGGNSLGGSNDNNDEVAAFANRGTDGNRDRS